MRPMLRGALVAGILAGLAFIGVTWPRPLTAPPVDNVYLEELTWVEVRGMIRSGKTTAVIPTAGVEQNGPHLVLGKHRYVVRHTAGRIATALGNALVAPVIDYVPEGSIDPPVGHMNFAGTISMPEEIFSGIVEHTARSLRQHGFTVIALVGDSGGNQAAQAAVAAKLNAEWAGTGARVIHVSDYYSAANGQVAWLESQGETMDTIGTHAGIRDSSELMATFPAGVRADRIAPGGGRHWEATGVVGDPTRASAERGRILLDLKVQAALRQIRAALGDSDA